MILYQSTRGDRKHFKFSQVLLQGIAYDGGLFIPQYIPSFTRNELEGLINKSYQEKSFFVLNKFRTDFSSSILKKIINKSYGKKFDHLQIAPLLKLKDNQYILELWHGPTFSFKDMALQIMPLFFSVAAKKSSHCYLILVATSGDTGKAALEGYKNKKGVKIMIFYPVGGVSRLQELQMITQEGENLIVLGMTGNFDDAQRSVKEVFADKKFQKKLLDKFNIVLSSANSINWGRLLPQIIYHVSSYLDLVKKKAINLGDEIDIAVPTGNFGNILAAFYAKKMGLPIGKLICASNENKVLTEFLQTGVYDINNHSLIKTPSPAIDIIVASNIERLLYEITKDPKKVAKWMKQFGEDKKFVVDGKTRKVLQSIFYADWVSNENCLKTIKNTYNETGYLMDPHTSVAKAVADRYHKQFRTNTPIIICSTAHWAKFASDVYKALRGTETSDNEFELIQKLIVMDSKLHVPQNILGLKNKKVLHKNKIQTTKIGVERVISQYLAK